jgi:NAD(P)-dependent dehydrogenase (short-subunit alcohol dehydrogenase family)
MSVGRLAGKRAIVTGAGSGIGRACALRFAEEGARVLAVDLAEAGVAETAAQIAHAGGQAEAVAADTADEASVAALVQKCVKDWGGLEVIHANAGISGAPKTILDLELDDWWPVLRVNLIGPFLAIKHAGRALVAAGGGSIICTASVAGLRSGAGGTPYSASKAGVVSLVQTAAYQLAGTGVRVNAICPGLIETGMTKPIYDGARAAGKESRIGQLNPLKRGGQPREIAALAAFLASDDASYVNGQAYAVDGGLSASHPYIPGRLA